MSSFNPHNEEVYGSEDDKSSWTQESSAGAAAYAAANPLLISNHQRKKELTENEKRVLADFTSGAEVKNLDGTDREKAKH
ncbi:hypothetical protein BGZ49_002706 [Haplosporangium sp. Z 27]|nr:hypothetical protein BGZ49_002706 [Haplosporangium sp. Z 27]